MIKDNYRRIQPDILRYLKDSPGHEMTFNGMYEILKVRYSKLSRVQLAANIIQLTWFNKVTWEPKEFALSIEKRLNLLDD